MSNELYIPLINSAVLTWLQLVPQHQVFQIYLWIKCLDKIHSTAYKQYTHIHAHIHTHTPSLLTLYSETFEVMRFFSGFGCFSLRRSRPKRPGPPLLHVIYAQNHVVKAYTVYTLLLVVSFVWYAEFLCHAFIVTSKLLQSLRQH